MPRYVCNDAYFPWNGLRIVSTYFSGAGEKIDASRYPWGWERTGYDDSGWNSVSLALPGSMKDTRNYRGRMLVPRPISPMEMSPVSFKSVRVAEGVAVLADMVEGDEAKALMRRILTADKVTRATIYFRYYINKALAKAGLGDELLYNLQPWHDQMALGLTTWAETPEPSRSDCHAWGSSPNIEIFRTVLGIDSDAPGFSKIRIAPSLGGIKEISGTMPHPAGDITVAYKVSRKGSLKAFITLPAGTSGTFVWKGREQPLRGGTQTVEIK